MVEKRKILGACGIIAVMVDCFRSCDLILSNLINFTASQLDLAISYEPRKQSHSHFLYSICYR